MWPIWAATIASTSLTENFSSNPFAPIGNWSFGIGDNSKDQFTWTNTPAAYTGDSTGELDVHLNSSLPTARFQRPLGVTLTDTNSITLAVSLGQIKTLIEHPFSMTHSALPDEHKRAFGMHPEGIRLSLGLEVRHDIIRDLELALEKL